MGGAVARPGKETVIMNCEHARQAWHDARDFGVTDPELTHHLESCEPCRVYFGQMGAIDTWLDELRCETERMVSDREWPPVKAGGFTVSRVRPMWRAAAMIALAVGLSWAAVGMWRAGHLFRIVGGGDVPPGLTNESISNAGGPAVAIDAPPPARATRVVLTGDTSGRYLAVEHQTSQPAVKFYWLFSTLGADVGDGSL